MGIEALTFESILHENSFTVMMQWERDYNNPGQGFYRQNSDIKKIQLKSSLWTKPLFLWKRAKKC